MANEIENPFVTVGYAGEKYFCDRKKETEGIVKRLRNGNNLALISPRRMGKSGLIWHCFDNREIRENFYTFYVDIYATLTLDEFVVAMGKEIVGKLKSKGEKALERFAKTVASLSPGISFDTLGNPTLTLLPGEVRNSDVTIDEIFRYLEGADRPCIVAIDEFQQITEYPQKNTEALLRTHIQKCRNSRFIFAGSRRHTMGEIFLSGARPFYQSVSMMSLGSIDRQTYFDFAEKHFADGGKKLPKDVFEGIYDHYDGVTWYIQKMLNTIYMDTCKGEIVSPGMVNRARKEIIDGFSYVYLDTLYRLTVKQKEVLIAIARAGKATGITSTKFIKDYALSGASSVQSASKWLLRNDFITTEGDCWYVYDYFFAEWLRTL
mgnify:FL=1